MQATGLVRRYGAAVAIGGVDLTLAPGERVVLLGPNGAGKTTLIRLLALALRPHAGALRIGGLDALRQPNRARRLVGMAGHQTYLYRDLSVSENLQFYARLYSVPRARQRVGEVLAELRIADLGDRLVRTLSRGMQQRAALARAILHDPAVLLLDEPETGLDEAAQDDLVRLVGRWAAEGKAVLLASHRLEWAQALADRAVVLRAGAVAAELRGQAAGQPDAIARAYREAIGAAGTT